MNIIVEHPFFMITNTPYAIGKIIENACKEFFVTVDQFWLNKDTLEITHTPPNDINYDHVIVLYTANRHIANYFLYLTTKILQDIQKLEKDYTEIAIQFTID